MNENESLLDDGLKAVMGAERCRDVTEDLPKKKKTVSKDEPADASWFPVKGKATDLELVVASAKATLPLALISALMFAWWQMELMAEIAAVPSCLVLALVAGVRLGGIWKAR